MNYFHWQGIWKIYKIPTELRKRKEKKITDSAPIYRLAAVFLTDCIIVTVATK